MAVADRPLDPGIRELGHRDALGDALAASVSCVAGRHRRRDLAHAKSFTT
jgi:hypothetical protein